MSDIFGTQNSKATQAVIDAASKILMGVKDEETAKAQTEEEHPAIAPENQEEVAEAKKMSSKEKMAKGMYNEKKMDPVGKEDGDIDNDGDEDDSDEYLSKRRKAIKKAMAKEGFDWPYCEHALTIGYRGSLTEIIQIIGRATRDSENKNHSQFTNLIAQPDVADSEVKLSVNNMLKAITASLLMEQVLAPHVNFKTKNNNNGNIDPGTIEIGGFKEPSTKKVKQILESDLNDLKATILQDDQMLKAIPGNLDPETSLEIIELFERLNKFGTSMIIATHDYNLIQKLKGKVYKCEDGKFFEVKRK